MTDEKTADITTIQRVSREMRMAQKVLTGDGPITGCVSAFAPLPVSPDILGSRLYTSYATSVVLRDAGAPQADYTDAELYYCGECGRSYLATPGNHWRRAGSEAWCGCGVHRTHARAFRADEIVEALHLWNPGCAIEISTWPEGWVVRLQPHPRPSGMAPEVETTAGSLVEALAAAWLAVLKEGKK